MKKITPFFSVLLFFVISSCASHTGSISSSIIPGNYMYEDIAFGVSQTNQYFGMGGLSKDALVLEAKRQLFLNRPLKANESYANFTIDIKRTKIIVYNQTIVTVSADIVAKGDGIEFSRFSENYISRLNRPNLFESFFEVGDSIIDKKRNIGVIIGVEGKKKYRIVYSTKDKTYRTKKVSAKDIFSSKKSHYGIKSGEKIENKARDIKGIILAVGIHGFLYEERNGIVFFSKYFNTAPEIE